MGIEEKTEVLKKEDECKTRAKDYTTAAFEAAQGWNVERERSKTAKEAIKAAQESQEKTRAELKATEIAHADKQQKLDEIFETLQSEKGDARVAADALNEAINALEAKSDGEGKNELEQIIAILQGFLNKITKKEDDIEAEIIQNRATKKKQTQKFEENKENLEKTLEAEKKDEIEADVEFSVSEK